jgi:phosphohistidine phosphatase
MLLLLRHGDAADGSPDAERPLTAKGREQSRAAGAALRARGTTVDACLSSPKVRALETARLACEELGGVEVEADERLAGGPFDAEELAAGRGDAVLLVGHEPDFSNAVRDLTGGRVKLKKGGIAAIEDGELRALLRPAELEAIARARGA